MINNVEKMKSWLCNYEFSPKGRILLGWKHNDITVGMLKKQSQLIHCSVMSKDGLHSILITATYGLHSIEDRKPLWAELQQLDNATVPWLVMGDYNAV